MFCTEINSVKLLLTENNSVYLHHRNVTKIRNFEMIRNSTFILKLKRYDYERIYIFDRNWKIQQQ
jgi:hypothetical protein